MLFISWFPVIIYSIIGNRFPDTIPFQWILFVEYSFDYVRKILEFFNVKAVQIFIHNKIFFIAATRFLSKKHFGIHVQVRLYFTRQRLIVFAPVLHRAKKTFSLTTRNPLISSAAI